MRRTAPGAPQGTASRSPARGGRAWYVLKTSGAPRLCRCCRRSVSASIAGWKGECSASTISRVLPCEGLHGHACSSCTHARALQGDVKAWPSQVQSVECCPAAAARVMRHGTAAALPLQHYFCGRLRGAAALAAPYPAALSMPAYQVTTHLQCAACGCLVSSAGARQLRSDRAVMQRPRKYINVTKTRNFARQRGCAAPSNRQHPARATPWPPPRPPARPCGARARPALP